MSDALRSAARGVGRGRLGWWLAALLAVGAVGCDDEGGDGQAPPADAVPRVDGAVDAAMDMGPRVDASPDAEVPRDRGIRDMAVVDMAAPDQGPALPACSDGADNDDDGVIDGDDPGCDGPDDDDEADPPRLCGDGVDNDGDGFIDILDPGCASDRDFTEEDPVRRPACANGRDDDEDGAIDLADPGCEAAGDDDEADPAMDAACGNGDDDDGDGLIDYPNDPGCGGPGDDNESDPEVLPACGNGADDDDDGTTDFPDDLGCDAAGDYDERLLCATGHEVGDLNAAMAAAGFAEGTTAGAPATQRGSCGGDAGGEVMFQYRVAEPVARVTFSTQHAETVAPTVLYVRATCGAADDLACNRGTADAPGTIAVLERPAPGTYTVVVDVSNRMIGPGPFRLTATEEPLPLCDDDLDNDGDGIIDFPADPGCESADDADETSPDPLPACADGIDNDADEAIDFPDDPDCEFAADDSEAMVGCLNAPDFQVVDNQSGRLELLTAGASAYQGTCGGGGGPEQVVLIRVRQPSRLRLETFPSAGGNRFDTLMYLRSGSCDMGQELGCNDDGGDGTLSLITLNNVAPGDYYAFVDAFGAGQGAIGLDVVVDPLGAACEDGVDNDADGRVDGDDPGCAAANDDDEEGDPAEPAACDNGVDDDGDGLTDFPLDPGCAGRGDDDEADPAMAPQCSDRADNDDDGAIDFPADPGCASAADNREADPFNRPACDNGADDDVDGLVDLDDPGCYGPGDGSEVDAPAPGACQNGVDDDDDGRVDYPVDPGCAFIGDLDEADPAEPPACANGADDDGDGLTDFPNEPGCRSAADDDEADPAVLPACGNGADDDGDGLVDYPADPGCAAAGDPNELNPPACDNDQDDDLDGAVDADDPGCQNRLDNDEADPAEAPACANGVDDDDDGFVDYPDDPECSAAGTPSESLSCGDIEVPTIFVGQAGGDFAFQPVIAPGQVQGSCGANFGSETLMVITLDEPSHLQVTFEGRVRRYLRTVCDDAASEVQCAAPASSTAISRFAAPAGTYYLFVEPENDRVIPIVAHVTITPANQACNNGEDDDGDGLVDAFDPGCRDAFDPDEADLAEAPACANAEDDDADGLIDYPDDPECRYAGARFEGRRCPGLDVDIAEFDAEGGSLLFQLRDGGGAAAGSCNAGGAREQVLAVTIEERSSITVTVRDGDGPASVYLYARRDCLNPASEASCNTTGGVIRLDDVPPGTWYIFVERSQFTAIEPLTATVAVQSTVTQCNDGADNDGDGAIDLADPGCANGNDGDEADPDEVPACANGADDDEDGLIDFPADFGCVAAGDEGESLACEATPDVIEVVIEPGVAQRVAYDTSDRPNLFEATCGSNARSPDQPFALVVPVAVTGTITVENFEGDSVLHIRRVCDDAASQITCNDDAVGLLSRLSFPRLEAGIYYVIADGYSAANSGPGELVFDLAAAPPACADGRDNDADGLVDLDDPGCEDADDDDEDNPALPACSNRLDDDQDMLTDLDDPGCDGPDDDDEFNAPLPACSNRLDDDGDGRIDAADPGCDGPDDVDEVNPPLCSDEADNDDDGLIDLADTGCTGPNDDDEADPAEVPACADGIDNDEDGAIDWPDDEDCPAAGGPSELLLCMATPDVIVVRPADAEPVAVPFDTTGREPLFTGSCGGGQAPDQVVAVVVDAPSSLRAEVTEADHDTVVYIRSVCDDAMTQLDCDDDGGEGLLSLAEVAQVEPGIYFVIVDGFSNRQGPGTLTVTVTPLPQP